MEGVVAKSTQVAESGGICDGCISTIICEECNKLARDRGALRGSIAELCAESRFEKVVRWFLDAGEKAVGKERAEFVDGR